MEKEEKRHPGRPRRDPNKLYKCPYCEKEYKGRDGLYKHIHSKHVEEWKRDKYGETKDYGEKIQEFKLEVKNLEEKDKEGVKPIEEKEEKEEKTIYRCPSCKEVVLSDATKCPYCGAEFDEEWG